MENKEIKELLQQIIANQGVIFQRIEDLYQRQIKNTQKSFFDDKKASEELAERAKKILNT